MRIDRFRTRPHIASGSTRKRKEPAEEIAARLKQIDHDTAALETRLQQLEQIIDSRDQAALEGFEKPAPAPKHPRKEVIEVAKDHRRSPLPFN